MEDDTFKHILQDKQFHLQIKAEQKEIISILEHLSHDFEKTTITAMYHGR
jgi:hypothetical protein